FFLRRGFLFWFVSHGIKTRLRLGLRLRVRGLVDAGFGCWVADDADGLPWAFTSAGIGLGTLAADREAAQMADAAIAFDGLKAFEVHADFAAQIAFDNIFAVLNGMNDLRKLLFA